MTKRELKQLIEQIEMQINMCRVELSKEGVSQEAIANIQGQINRQTKELNNLLEVYNAMPDEPEAIEAEVVG